MMMRTTLTLDADVAAKLEEEMRATGKSFKQAVNETLRMGLLARREIQPRKPFRVEARNLGTYPGLNYDNVEELLDQVEGPWRL